jgi:pimeloyl-ACP methyl ester carboxylesterase
MRSDFLFWAMITYNRPFGYQMLGVPSGFPLTPAHEVLLNESLATTLPISGRINGFLFDNYDPQYVNDFYESISEASPYPLGEIKTPVLLIDAEDDPYSNIENVRSLGTMFPNARLFVVPDGGHPHLGHAEEVNGELIQFLNSYVDPLNSN